MTDTEWGQFSPDKFKDQPRSHGMRTIVLSLLAIIIIAGGVGYYFIFRPQPANVSLVFSNPGTIPVGQPFSVSLSYSNASDKTLSNASLSAILPDGVSFVGQPSDQRVMEKSVQNIAPGGAISAQEFPLIVTGGGQSLKHIAGRLTYTINNVSFTTDTSIDIPASQPSVSLALSLPEKIYSGENFDIGIHYANTSGKDLQGIQLQLQYPSSFVFVKSSLASATGTGMWAFDLPKDATGSITVTGYSIAADASFFSIQGTMVQSFEGQTYTINSQTATLGVSASPLSLTVTPNGDAKYVAHVGDTAHYLIAYKNNSTTTLQNVSITAKLRGELFNFSSVNTQGTFNSVTNSVHWDQSNTPGLVALAPGDQGTVDITVPLLATFPISRLSDKNFLLTVNATIESPTVPPGVSAQKTVSIADVTSKVGGVLSLKASGYFRDPTASVTNRGPFPPRVNQPTQYSVHWAFTNYATDMQHIVATAVLQSGVTFVKVVKTSTDTGPVYNPNSHELRWEIASIPATKGVISKPLEAVFQIQQTPSSNQVGQISPLIGPVAFQATDAWTSSTISGSGAALDASLPDDQSVRSSSLLVQP